jgi:hypothetical protein
VAIKQDQLDGNMVFEALVVKLGLDPKQVTSMSIHIDTDDKTKSTVTIEWEGFSKLTIEEFNEILQSIEEEQA